MIREINHIWTAEMKWKWRNDRRSERNLCNCVNKPEKKVHDLNGIGIRDLAITGAMLYQLSYEATDVWRRSIVGSYVPVKEMKEFLLNDLMVLHRGLFLVRCFSSHILTIKGEFYVSHDASRLISVFSARRK